MIVALGAAIFFLILIIGYVATSGSMPRVRDYFIKLWKDMWLED